MDRAHEQTERIISAMEKRISGIYARAGKELAEKAADFLKEFEAADAEKAALVAEGKLNKRSYYLWRREQIMQTERFIQFQELMAVSLANTNKIALAYINGRLPEIYSLNYNFTGNGVKDAVSGYSFSLLDASTVKRLSATNAKLLPTKRLDIPRDKLWNRKHISSEMLQGIMQGESIPKMADRLKRVTDMNANSAVRNARTMATSAQNAGRIDMMKKAESDGIIIKKLWIATPGGRTRDWHADLDGKTADLDEPFENDFGKIRFPGDPEADPANIYNCRCTLGTEIVGFRKAKR